MRGPRDISEELETDLLMYGVEYADIARVNLYRNTTEPDANIFIPLIEKKNKLMSIQKGRKYKIDYYIFTQEMPEDFEFDQSLLDQYPQLPRAVNPEFFVRGGRFEFD